MQASFVTPREFEPNMSPKLPTERNWFQAMAEAWGRVLDKKAADLLQASESIGTDGNNTPGHIVKFQAMAQEFAFTATTSATANNAVGQGLETVARKQG